MSKTFNTEAYELAQDGVTLLKGAIVRVLADHPEGIKASELGRMLGINADFTGDQEGWLQWTVLKIMEMEKTVVQVKERGPWKLRVD